MNSVDKLPRCQNKQRRLNLKSKRKRNLIKKAIELSQMLEMDMLVLFKDRDTGKITQYMSGGTGRDAFTIDRAMAEIEAWKAKKRVIKMYNDDDYSQFKSLKTDQLDDDDDDPFPILPKDAIQVESNMMASLAFSKAKEQGPSLSLPVTIMLPSEPPIEKRQRRISMDDVKGPVEDLTATKL